MVMNNPYVQCRLMWEHILVDEIAFLYVDLIMCKSSC